MIGWNFSISLTFFFFINFWFSSPLVFCSYRFYTNFSNLRIFLFSKLLCLALNRWADLPVWLPITSHRNSRYFLLFILKKLHLSVVFRLYSSILFTSFVFPSRVIISGHSGPRFEERPGRFSARHSNQSGDLPNSADALVSRNRAVLFEEGQ